MNTARALMLMAGVLGATGVALAAVGAHVAGGGGFDGYRAWQSASLIHLVHVPALLAIGVAADRYPRAGWRWPGLLIVTGVLLFSGSIYRSGLLQLDGAGPLAPVGGSTLIFAWLVVGWCAWRSRS